eukprot:318386_1
MDFDFMSADIDTTHQQPSHHKKHSTFANVPFAETHGLDDFIGFSATETELNQEIKDLKDKVQSQQDLIDSKDLLILQLRNENTELKNELANMNSRFQIQSHNDDNDSNKSDTLSPIASNDNNQNTLNILSNKSIKGIPPVLRPSQKSQTTEGSALFSKISNKKKETDDELKHQISASLNNFLDTLDFKFKEDENENKLTDENETEIEEEYIYNPTAIMDIDGHLPQLRRSSLSEEEQERMELEAVNQLKNINGNDNNNNKEHIGNNAYNNVIFNDSNVNNMNMNIINHHNHMSNHNHNKDTNINSLKMEILQLTNIIQQMRKAKIQLIMSTENEINRLRTIIRKHIK